MAVKRNAIEFADEYLMATKVVETSFYVDDCLTGADNVKTTIVLQLQLQDSSLVVHFYSGIRIQMRLLCSKLSHKG